MKADPGFNIQPTYNPIGFSYGPDCFGPVVENRHLDSIRSSLLDPNCNGPDPVYSIAMDVGKKDHLSVLQERKLLFGAVIYSSGRLGNEPVRSQGHVHVKTRENRISPPEVYEIWNGRAIIFMQESVENDPGSCFAVEAMPGEVVVVPPDWAHATISADPSEPLIFGAWCDRDYSFEYSGVRAHGGLAWFPILDENNRISWMTNSRYLRRKLTIKKPGNYHQLGLKAGIPIYRQFEEDPEIFGFVSDPHLQAENWKHFTP